MKFQTFWRLYLRAHRMPGTRALHYFATAFGILSAVEAVIAHQPLIFVVGIAVSYAIAIAAHWFVEGNQPLIRVHAFWGAVADLRMCWLAATGRLAAELARHGIDPALPQPRHMTSIGAARRTTPADLRKSLARYALVLASAAGLSAGLADLGDLFEPIDKLTYPTIQIGAPIIAFAGALALACMALHVARHGAPVLQPLMDSTMMAPATLATSGWTIPEIASTENSLRRAALALLAFGLAAFGLAELLEHGVAPLHLLAADTMLVATPWAT